MIPFSWLEATATLSQRELSSEIFYQDVGPDYYKNQLGKMVCLTLFAAYFSKQEELDVAGYQGDSVTIAVAHARQVVQELAKTWGEDPYDSQMTVDTLVSRFYPYLLKPR